MTTATYTSPAEDAAHIRAECKRLLGANQRQVSVRSRSYSMGSSLDIDIHDPAVDITKVREIAEPHESISRDEYTGEILSGSNRYLTVRYSDKAAEAFTASHPDLVKLLAEVPAQGSGRIYLVLPVDGRRVYLSRDGWQLSLRDMNAAGGKPHWLPDAPHLTVQHLAAAVLGMRGAR